jgi:hypothetical protein
VIPHLVTQDIIIIMYLDRVYKYKCTVFLTQ